MAQTYGKGTVIPIDRALTLRSVFAPYFGDNGYKFTGKNTITVLSMDNGTLAGYNENSVSYSPVTLVGTTGNDYTLDYNQAMFARIQNTLMQDTPISNFAAKWARQQIEEVFIPTHDVYSIGKLVAARQSGQLSDFTVANLGGSSSDRLPLVFNKALQKVRQKGGRTSSMVALLSDTFGIHLADQITFTGSDAGYRDAKNDSFLGKLYGVTCVTVPDNYFPWTGSANDFRQVYGVIADKRAVLNVTPKMSPSDYRVLTQVPAFSGSEVQIRDRGATFVLEKKKWAIATIQGNSSSASTTTPAPDYTQGTTAAPVTQL